MKRQLDEAAIRADKDRAVAEIGELGTASQMDQLLMANHIDDLFILIRRNRRLLEAGERLAEAVGARVETAPSEVHPTVRHALAAYQEAVKS